VLGPGSVPGGAVTERASSGGAYVSVRVGPVRVDSPEQVRGGRVVSRSLDVPCRSRGCVLGGTALRAPCTVVNVCVWLRLFYRHFFDLACGMSWRTNRALEHFPDTAFLCPNAAAQVIAIFAALKSNPQLKWCM
jgi:hypothetical protein